MKSSLSAILTAAAALMLFCSSCQSPSTPELWDFLKEPGITRQERLKREGRLVRRLEQEQKSIDSASADSHPSPSGKQ